MPGIDGGTVDVSLVLHDKLTAGMANAQRGVEGFESKLSTIGDKIQNFGGKLTGLGTKLMMIYGAASAAILLAGKAFLGPGWERAITVQNALSSLTITLGDAAKAKSLIDKVQVLGMGTPYTLTQLSKATQMLVAFGIEGDKSLEVITAIMDIAQGDSGTMSSLVDTFGKIQAQGTVNMENMWSLASANVNGLAILGNSYGKTTDQIRKMISDGAIPATKAIDMLTKGIEKGTKGVNGMTPAFGGLALGLGDQLQGSLANVGAAVARFGQKLIEDMSPDLVAFFKALSKQIDGLKATLLPQVKSGLSTLLKQFVAYLPKLIDMFSKWLPIAINTVIPMLDSLLEVIVDITKFFSDMDAGTKKNIITWILWGYALGPVLTTVGMLTNGVGGLFKAIGWVSGALTKGSAVLGISKLAMGGWVTVILLAVAAVALLIINWNKLTDLQAIKDKNDQGGRPGKVLGGMPAPGRTELPTIGYATGGVFQPNSPKLIMVGDNKREREVISPLSTMKEAFASAMAENGTSRGGNTYITVRTDRELEQVMALVQGTVKNMKAR